MFAAACRVIAALAMLAVPFVAVAQVIPPSELPGRQRERFEQPPTAASTARGTARNAAEHRRAEGRREDILRVRGVRIVGSTVYTQAQLAPLYANLIGRSRFARDDLRTRATHHGAIRQ